MEYKRKRRSIPTRFAKRHGYNCTVCHFGRTDARSMLKLLRHIHL